MESTCGRFAGYRQCSGQSTSARVGLLTWAPCLLTHSTRHALLLASDAWQFASVGRCAYECTPSRRALHCQSVITSSCTRKREDWEASDITCGHADDNGIMDYQPAAARMAWTMERPIVCIHRRPWGWMVSLRAFASCWPSTRHVTRGPTTCSVLHTYGCLGEAARCCHTAVASLPLHCILYGNGRCQREETHAHVTIKHTSTLSLTHLGLGSQ
ncbi:hypothetical protein J3F84DRAFT_156366 [Trichoderma pleuroticola]